MICSITGRLVRVLEEELRIEVGAFEYQVLVPDLVRRNLQTKLTEEVTLHTIEFLEGNPARGSRMTPRLVGFSSEAEIEFFDLFCTVDGIGIRKALKALVRPVRDVADMIARQDVQAVTTLPGISASLAERVIAKLRRKVTKFALIPADEQQADPAMATDQDVAQEALMALLSVGHSEADARRQLEQALAAGKRFKTAQDILLTIYQSQ